MKYLAFAAALMIGGSAFAQASDMQEPSTTEPQTEAPAEGPMDQSAPADTTGQAPAGTMDQSAPADTSSQPMSSDPGTGAASGQSMSSSGSGGMAPSGNSRPERDARGIPVVSNAAEAPSGANQAPPAGSSAVPAPNQQAVFAPRPAAGEYPPCSRGQTDGCTQTYERGRSPQ